jgi:hypothetical protein
MVSVYMTFWCTSAIIWKSLCIFVHRNTGDLRKTAGNLRADSCMEMSCSAERWCQTCCATLELAISATLKTAESNTVRSVVGDVLLRHRMRSASRKGGPRLWLLTRRGKHLS